MLALFCLQISEIPYARAYIPVLGLLVWSHFES